MQSQAMNPLTHKFRLLMVTGIVPLENSERFEPKGIIFFASLVLFYSMPTSVVALLILLRSFIRSRVDLQLENLALPSNRRASTPAEETPENNRNGPLFWASLSRIRRDWHSALVIVEPQTVVAWHRMGSRLFLDLEGSKSAGQFPA